MVKFIEVQEQIDFSKKAFESGKVNNAVNALLAAFQDTTQFRGREFNILATSIWHAGNQIALGVGSTSVEGVIARALTQRVENISQTRMAPIVFPSRDRI